ncbi:MAG: preprotein translocase subunit Tim44 [Rhodobacteraceae bacterium]|nr:preprotein translocase subunit Tim44 [Paracoccaceae bacterium]|tara:strand:- start:298 stop:951 length:654 start_codon:yes stop_codon:yes gene_type:complete
MLQIFILAAVAIFLFWRLKAVLGSREGFEKTHKEIKTSGEVIKSPGVKNEPTEPDSDDDIFDYVEEDSASAEVFKKMKEFDGDFSVNKFVSGAKMAYEIIIMAFENGDIEKLGTLLEKKVLKSFKSVIEKRKKDGYVVDAKFIGMRDIRITDASFSEKTKTADITLSFKSEISTVVKDVKGTIIEGHPDEIKKQKDTWVFTKNLSEKSPMWLLKSTI